MVRELTRAYKFGGGKSSILSANLPDPITQVTSQERSQGDAISVANTFGNLIDALIAGLQEMDRAFDPQTLKIRQRRLPQYGVHAARECPLAGCDRFRRFAQGEPVRESGAGPSFETFHQGIVVNEMIAQDVRGLRRPRVDDQVFRCQVREFWTVLPNQPERQIHVTQRCAGGDDPSRFDEHM